MTKGKVLFVASVYKFFRFEVNDIRLLHDYGYEVYVASNMNEAEWLRDDGFLDSLVSEKINISFARTPFSKDNHKAKKQLKVLFANTHFDIVHCHTPVAASILRSVANKYRKSGTKVIYTSHGFHFHKKSSFANWLLFYPVERLMARKTDMIITINKEDFRAIQSFKCKLKRYIPSVGIDTHRIESIKWNKNRIFNSLGVPQNAFSILCIGELSDRKNQQVLIKALGIIKKDNIFLILCGTGSKLKYLKELAKECNVDNNVLFLGQQDYDFVLSLCHCVDIGAIPSKIEGLGLAGIEIMCSDKPLVGSSIQGINDYLINGVTGFACDPTDVKGFATNILYFYNNKEKKDEMGKNAHIKAKEFDIEIVNKLMMENYKIVREEI